MSLFREDRVQFVPVVFDLIDHPLFHRWSPEGFKLYVWLRRHIWRDPQRAPREIRPFYEQGFLAAYATKDRIADDCMQVSNRSLSDIFKELRDIGACRTQNTGRGYVFLLGEWRRWTSPETGQEVYAEGWYLDLQVEESPGGRNTLPPSRASKALSDKQNLPGSDAEDAPQVSNTGLPDRHPGTGRKANAASINKEEKRKLARSKKSEERSAKTTTTTRDNQKSQNRLDLPGLGDKAVSGDEDYLSEVLATYEAANGRSATALEKNLLRAMSDEFDQASREGGSGDRGADWLVAAIVEAVESGSSYIAPRRIRQICERWQRDGFGLARSSRPGNTGKRRASTSPGRASGEDVSRLGGEAQGRETEKEVQTAGSWISARGGPSRATEADLTLWARTLSALEQQVSRANFDTWLRDSQLVAQEGNHWVIGVRNHFVRDWIDSRLRGHIQRALSDIVAYQAAVSCVVLEGDGE